MNSITIQKLANNPLLAYTIAIPQPHSLNLTNYESTAFPAIIGTLTNLSIQKVVGKYKMGRIYSIDVEPRNTFDPIVVFSPIGELKEYYKIWGKIMSGRLGFFRNGKIKAYDESIKTFLRSTENSGLTVHESVFAVIEMLKFKNDILLNPNVE